MPFYSANNTPFKHHVGTSLQKRLNIFIGIIGIMVILVAYDLYTLVKTDASVSLSTIILFSAGAAVAGGLVGLLTMRIFRISWNEDAKQVIGRIDKIGAVMLVIYILIETARSFLFEQLLSDAQLATTIGFVFIAAALSARVYGMRRRIVQVLHEQKLLKK